MCLGSNLGDTDANLRIAITAIDALKGVTVMAVSPIYRTEPQEKKDQPWFANQIIHVECDSVVTPENLMASLLVIEEQMGRDRSNQEHRFGPRVIDLDLLLFGEEELRSDFLTLPHPRMRERAFVLVPLRDLAPELAFPDGQTLIQALEALEYRVEDDRIWQ